MIKNKIIRLLYILEHLPIYPRKITAQHLFEQLKEKELSNTIRTIQRDLKQLQEFDTFGVGSDYREKPYGWYRVKNWQGITLNSFEKEKTKK